MHITITQKDACLIPLLMLELYFVAVKDTGNPIKIVFSTGLVIMTLLMVMGLYAASAGMWFPNVGAAA